MIFMFKKILSIYPENLVQYRIETNITTLVHQVELSDAQYIACLYFVCVEYALRFISFYSVFSFAFSFGSAFHISLHTNANAHTQTHTSPIHMQHTLARLIHTYTGFSFARKQMH